VKGPVVSFAAVKQRVPLEAVLKHYHVEDLRGRGDHRRGPCPMHRGEGRESFHVDMERKIFHCFSCHEGGDLLDLVAKLEGCTLRQAALLLRDRFGVKDEQTCSTLVEQRVTKGKVVAGNPPLPFRLRGVEEAHAYVAYRRIEPSTATRFGVGYYGGPGLMQGRVVIPIHDEYGQLVAYAGRALKGEWPRYKFPGGFRKSQVLFNFHRAAATLADTVVVVEGFFDCLRVSQAGIENVVALMGTELYEHPAQLLGNRFAAGVVLLLDGDDAGRMAQRKIVSRLRERCRVRVVELPDRVQPDQMREGELRSILLLTGRLSK
jgi:DNA primase